MPTIEETNKLIAEFCEYQTKQMIGQKYWLIKDRWYPLPALKLVVEKIRDMGNGKPDPIFRESKFVVSSTTQINIEHTYAAVVAFIEWYNIKSKKMKTEIEFVKSLLPAHYIVKESSKKGSIHCVSEIGIRKLPYLNTNGRLISDDEDEAAWDRFFKSVKQHFGDRFQEIDHNTCFCHVNFTIYLKA